MIVVAGGTGFVGSATVRELCRRGKRVAVLGRDANKIARRFPDLQVEARRGDVRDTDSLREAFRDAEVVINAVQFPNSPIENRRKGRTFEQIDYAGTLNQLLAAKAAGIRRFVYTSGAGASLDAKKHWFVLKARAEEAVRASGMTYVIVRPTWVYGLGDVSLNRFVGFARRLRFVPMFGDGKQEMQPLFVDDLGRILAEAAERAEADNQTFEAGGPERMTMDDVIKTALDVAGLRRPVLHQPVAMGKLIGTFARVLPNPPLTPDAIDFIAQPAVADNSALERVLSPKITPFRAGLETYLARKR